MRVPVNDNEEILSMEVHELVKLLASITLAEDCGGVTMLIKSKSNHGDFLYKFSCNKIEEQSQSRIDKIKGWFNGN